MTVNGKTAALGDRADPQTDCIELDGQPVSTAQPPVYLMLHKPRGFVTTMSDEQGRRTAAQLVSDCGARVYPIGRLDLSSEGLLLFTNDGALAKYLTHPSHQVEKTYLAWVTDCSIASLDKIQRSIVLDGKPIAPPDVRCLRRDDRQALLLITIREGRNRQIRRMCDAAGMHVNRLRRVSEGGVELGELPCGKWRYLTDAEIRMLKSGM